MNYVWYSIPLLLLITIPGAYAQVETTTGENYDLVENYFTGEAQWTSHVPRIMDGTWKNFVLENNSDKVIFNSNSIGSFVFDKNSCSYSIYENGYVNPNTQIIPSVSAVATHNDGTWTNMDVNDSSCNVTVTQNDNGIVLTSTKVITEDITEDVFIEYTGTTENFYVNATNANFDLIQFSNGTNSGYFNGQTNTIIGSEKEKFVQKINLDINQGIKETFYIYDNTDSGNQLGISQTVHVGESIVMGDQEIIISQFDGQSFDRQFIIDNESEIIQVASNLNYDFDEGIDSLTSLNVIHDSGFLSNTYKINLDYSEGSFVGYLEIDPTFGYTDGVTYRAQTASQTGSSCSTSGSGITSDRLQVRMEASSNSESCFNTAFEFDISSLPTNISVSDTKFKFNNDVNDGSRNCDYTKVTTQPSTLSGASGASTLFAEINSGTAYVDNDSACTSTGTKIIDLGTTADNDLATARASGQTWIAYGLTFNDMSRDSLTHSLRDNGGGDGGSIEITYDLTTAPDAPTGLTTVTGLPVELSFSAPGDNGGSAITQYSIYRTDNPYAFLELPNNSANANGVDFTSNELLIHGFESVLGSATLVSYDINNADTQQETRSGSTTSNGVQILSGNSAIGHSLSEIMFPLKKSGSPPDTFRYEVYNSAGTLQAQTPTSSANSLTTSFVDTTLTLTTPHTIVAGDRIVITYSSGDVSNKILVSEDNSVGSIPSTTTHTAYNSGWSESTAQWSNAKFLSLSSSFTVLDKSTNSIPITYASGQADLLNDDFDDNSNSWTQVGSTATIDFSTDERLELSSHHVDDVNQNRLVYSFTNPLPNEFTVEFDYKSTNAVGNCNTVILGFVENNESIGASSNTGIGFGWQTHNNYFQNLAGLFQEDDGDQNPTFIHDSNFDDGVQYYFTIVFNQSSGTGVLKGYSDSARTTQVGSDVNLSFTKNWNSLNYMNWGDVYNEAYPCYNTSHLDNLVISTLQSIAPTATTGIMGSDAIQDPNLSFTDSNLPDNSDAVSVGAWVKLDKSDPEISATSETNQEDITRTNAWYGSGMYVKPDGTKLWTYSISGGVNEYSMTAGDLSTISQVGSTFTTANADIKGLEFNADGTKMFFTKTVNNAGHPSTIQEWGLGTAYDLSTADGSQTGQTDLASNGQQNQSGQYYGSLQEMRFSSDGMFMFVADNDGIIFRHDLTSAYTPVDNLTQQLTIPDNTSGSPSGRVHGFQFTDDGKTLFTSGYGDINQHTLSVAWDLTSTITHDGSLTPSVTQSTHQGGRQAISLSNDMSKLWTFDQGASQGSSGGIDTIFEYNTGAGTGNTKLFGLNDVSFNIGSTDASIIELGSALTTSQTTKSDGRGLWNGQPRTELGQQFNSGHVVIGETPTKVTWQLYKTGSPTGLVYSHIKDSSGTIKETSTTTLDPSTLTAGSSNDSAIEFTFAGTTTIVAGDMVTVQYAGGSSGNEVGVRTDNSGAVTNSVFRQYTGSWADISGEALAYIVTYVPTSTIISVGSLADNTSTPQHYAFVRGDGAANTWKIYQGGTLKATATDSTSLGSNSGQDYTINIDGMTDEYFISSTAYDSTTIDNIASRGDALTAIGTTTTTTFDDSTATGINYYSVRAQNAIGLSPYLTPFVSGQAGVAWNVPQNLSATISDVDATPLLINLSWDASTQGSGTGVLTGYEIFKNNVSIGTVGLVTSTTHQLTAPGTNDFTIKSLSTHLNSATGNVASVTTPTAPGISTMTTAINNVNSAPLAITSTLIPGTTGGSSITGFNLYFSDNNSNYISIVNNTSSPYTHTASTPGTKYLKSEAVNNVGIGPMSIAYSITTPTVPNAITDVAGSAVTDTRIDISFSQPSNGGSALNFYKIFKDGTQVDTTTNLTYSLTGLASNTAYAITVFSNNNVGDSLVSNTANISTYQTVSGSISITKTTEGAVSKLEFTPSVTGTPTPNFSTFTLKENGVILASGISTPYYLAHNDFNSANYTISSTDNSHWDSPTISGATTAQSAYEPAWKNTVSYDYARANGVMTLNVNENTQALWDADCTYRTTNQVLSDVGGVNSTHSGVWYVSESQNLDDKDTVYVSCSDGETKLLSFTSFGPNRLGGGIAQLDDTFEGMIGTPVALIFVLLVAGLFTGRSAPTGILLVLALVGVLGFIGMLTIDEAIWGFLLLAGVLGIFLGKRFL